VSLERTLVLVKPDGVQRGLAGEVLGRLEGRGLKLVALKLMKMTDAIADQHYEAHVDKPFFPGLKAFMTSSPIVAAVFEGPDAVRAARAAMGATDPLDAVAGTIRGDLGLNIGRNVVHSSDSPQAAERETKIFFSPEELLTWERDAERWIVE